MSQFHKSNIKNSNSSPENSTTVPAPISDLLTIAEVAAYLKLSKRTTWRWCKSGRLPATKVGHQWRIHRNDLENFVHSSLR